MMNDQFFNSLQRMASAQWEGFFSPLPDPLLEKRENASTNASWCNSQSTPAWVEALFALGKVLRGFLSLQSALCTATRGRKRAARFLFLGAKRLIVALGFHQKPGRVEMNIWIVWAIEMPCTMPMFFPLLLFS
jgi:hypothetical protein